MMGATKGNYLMCLCQCSVLLMRGRCHEGGHQVSARMFGEIARGLITASTEPVAENEIGS